MVGSCDGDDDDGGDGNRCSDDGIPSINQFAISYLLLDYKFTLNTITPPIMNQFQNMKNIKSDIIKKNFFNQHSSIVLKTK